MSRTTTATVALAVVFSVAALKPPATSAEPDRPNIVVFYSDDHGHADLSCQGVLSDIKTPHIDSLAERGVLARHGYSTAPQCVPSRAGLLVGKFQSRFGVESNGQPLDGFNREQTIAERLSAAGYVTAQFGKWHLGPTTDIVDHGFKHVFSQNAGRPFSANVTIEGIDRPMSDLAPQLYHVDGCSRAAASLIERYKDSRFFFYIAYRAPHVPLDAPQQYLDRFPGEMPERRRQALAMLSAVDDGVGLICDTLAEHGLTEKTLIFFIGDNGAPLKIHKRDEPGGGPGWDGSLNDPLNGEKGMLAEGGMHVPFVISWPGTIPSGQRFEHPVSALDVAATAAALAEISVAPGELDGVNLMPHLTGATQAAPHEALMWRWVAQSAIRQGKWKLLRGGPREYLFDLDTDLEEKHDLSADYPQVADRLRKRLSTWAAELDPPGLTERPMSEVWDDYFDYYLEGKPAPPLKEKFLTQNNSASGSNTLPKGFVGRNADLSVVDGQLKLTSRHKQNQNRPFIACSGFSALGPVVATITLRSDQAGACSMSWRTSGEKDFSRSNNVSFQIEAAAKEETHEVKLPVGGELIHLRIILPTGNSGISELRLQGSDGTTVKLWN